MKYPRYSHIPQCVFPNQRDTEKVFVLTRRHYVDFLTTILATLFLVIFPILLGAFILANYPDIEVYESLGLIGRDVVILVLCAYYLLISGYFVTAWFRYYYDILAITDDRIIDISQKGLFHREVYELTYEQIEDITTKTDGFLNTIFEAGDIQIQTAGSQRNFDICRVPKPSIVSEIIHSIGSQARDGVKEDKRMPNIATIALIEGSPIVQGDKVPEIMNFRKDLQSNRHQYVSHIKEPKTLREAFDRWWWSHMKRDQGLFVDYDYIKKVNDKNKTKGDKS